MGNEPNGQRKLTAVGAETLLIVAVDSATTSSALRNHPFVMVRKLTDRERSVIEAMIDLAAPFEGDSVSAEDRTRWRAQLPQTFAGETCGCGTCPSIELTDVNGNKPDTDSEQVILVAGCNGAILMLFIHEDRPAYMELAPPSNTPILEFPHPDEINFG